MNLDVSITNFITVGLIALIFILIAKYISKKALGKELPV